MNISISTKAITDCLSKTQGIFSKSSKDTIYVYVLLETIGKSEKIETKNICQRKQTMRKKML